MATTRIDLIDSALMRIGSQPMQSESAPNAAQQLKIYASITGYCLSANPWSWNTVTRELPRLSEAPLRYWQYQFELPADRLGTPRAVYASSDCRNPFTGFELDDGVLKTNATNIWLCHDKRSEPVNWPGYFSELIEVALMAEFALSVREDKTMRNDLRVQAFGTPSEMGQGGLMGVAMGIDAQAKPSPVLQLGSNPLLAARFGS